MLRADDLGLSRPGRARAGARHVEQHAADQSVPQRRTPGGDVRDRAAVRSRGAAVRLRPHRPAAAQSGATIGAALRQSARHGLRLRRLREGRWTARWRSPTGRASASARRESKRNGKLRGIGLANYIEATSGAPRECAKVHVLPEGRIDVTVGTLSSGQGHETSFAQCVAEWLGADVEQISLIQGDTDIVPIGGGTHSDRSMRMAGVVMGKASELVIAKGGRIAALVLETDAADVDSPRPLHREGHRPFARPVRGGEGRARAQRLARRSARTAGRRKRRVHPHARLSIRQRMSARSRSTRRPAGSRSCATPRSTTSAAPSIR